ncbi:MAG: Ig-like domain-containing protein [Chitinophagales bacterium]
MVTASVCDAGDLAVTVTDGSLCVDITNDADGFQADQICVVHCDALGNCDTTIIIVTPEPPVYNTDTIYVDVPENGTTVSLCPTAGEIGDVVDVINLGCDTDLHPGSSIITDTNGCIIYTAGPTSGDFVDTFCLVAVDSFGNTDTTVYVISITPEITTDTVTIVMVPNDTLEVCLGDEIQVSPIDDVFICGVDVDVNVEVNAGDSCVTVITGPNFDSEQELCVVHCSSGICDTTIIVVLPAVTSDTIYINVPVSETTDALCATGDDIGTIVSNSDLGCDVVLLEGSSTSSNVEGCVIYTAGTTPGNFADTICVVGTDVNGNNDTTVYIITVVPVTDTIYVPDDTVVCLDDVVTISGPIDTIYSCNGADISVDTTNTQCGIVVTIPESLDPNQVDTICVVTCSGAICDTTIIVVTPIGNPPVAVDDYDTTSINVPVEVSVLDNDYDPDNDSIALITVITDPENGTVTVDQTAGTITYDPNPGYVGIDSFQYVICDVPLDGCDTAWVYISIKDEECLFLKQLHRMVMVKTTSLISDVYLVKKK